MEEKYMIEIHAVYGLKSNADLTAADCQELVLEILHKFRKQAEDWGPPESEPTSKPKPTPSPKKRRKTSSFVNRGRRK